MQTLVNFGSAIKADDSGRVRGYLVRFGGQDLEGDFFTPQTDFGRPMKSGDRVPMNLYYHHGQDKDIGHEYLKDIESRYKEEDLQLIVTGKHSTSK